MPKNDAQKSETKIVKIRPSELSSSCHFLKIWAVAESTACHLHTLPNQLIIDSFYFS